METENEFKRKLREKRPDMTNEDIEFICEKLDGLQSNHFVKVMLTHMRIFCSHWRIKKCIIQRNFGRQHLKIVTQVIDWTHYRAAINAVLM